MLISEVKTKKIPTTDLSDLSMYIVFECNCWTTVPPINFIGMIPDTLILQQNKKNWASPCNKQNLQSLAEIAIHRYNKFILSFAFNEGELHPAKLFTVGQENEVNALSDSSLEEAYGWFIIHVGWTVEEKHCEKVIAVLKYRCVYLACLSPAITGEQVP